MKSSLLLFVDLDGTIINVNDRFILSKQPPLKKDRLTKEYQDWLDSVQTPDLLAKDTPVPGMQEFVSKFEDAVYLTSRSEKILQDTLKWLRTHNFPIRELIMRPETDYDSAAKFKERAILAKLQDRAEKDGSHPWAYNVVVIDDDTNGELENICHAHNWCFFKAKSGGIVL